MNRKPAKNKNSGSERQDQKQKISSPKLPKMEKFVSFATIAQGITAIASLILAIVAMLQTTKIKELGNIVDKLNKQNEIYEQELDVNKKTTILNRSPFLVLGSEGVSSGIYTISLRNIGMLAYNLEVTIPDPNPNFEVLGFRSFVNQNEEREFQIRLFKPYVESFDFIVKYESYFGPGEQRVSKKDRERITVSPPKGF